MFTTHVLVTVSFAIHFLLRFHLFSEMKYGERRYISAAWLTQVVEYQTVKWLRGFDS